MTTTSSLATVPPLDFPRPSFPQAVRPGQALVPSLPAPPDSALSYAVITLGRWGRLAAAHVVSQLGWFPGHQVRTIVRDGLIALNSSADDLDGPKFTVDRRFHLRLPARVCHLARVTEGDQVLAVGYTRDDLLLVTAPADLQLWYLAGYRSRCVSSRLMSAARVKSSTANSICSSVRVSR